MPQDEGRDESEASHLDGDVAAGASRPVELPRSRSSALRWGAPLLSIAVLSFLVARVSTCSSTAKHPARTDAARESSSVEAAEESLVPLRGTKSFGIEAPAEKALSSETREAPAAATPSDTAGNADGAGSDLQFLGGSKSGFGGLGLRGTGRTPQAQVPGAAEPAKAPP